MSNYRVLKSFGLPSGKDGKESEMVLVSPSGPVFIELEAKEAKRFVDIGALELVKDDE